MTNLFTRLKDMISADLHEAMDEKEKQNPIALLNQYLRQSEQETEKVRKLLERQYLLKNEFTREIRLAQELASKRKHQAEIASKAGELTLFHFAAEEQQQYESRVERLQQSLQLADQQLSELEKKYEEMRHKLKDMNIRRLELMGRENVTRAHHQMNRVLETNHYTDRAASRFEEIENYLERIEHQVNSSYFRSTIDAKIAQLEKEMKVEQTHSIS